MSVVLGSHCKEMSCTFCPSWNAVGDSPDYLQDLDYPQDWITVTGLEPLNAASFFSTIERIRERSPNAQVTIETTGLPLLDAALRERVAQIRNVVLVIPLYGKDGATNAAVTGNPHFLAQVETLLGTELRDRIRFQTMALRANIAEFGSFLDWAREKGLVFEKYRVLLIRDSPPERELYRSNVVPFPQLVENFIAKLQDEPAGKFDGCFAALPRCVLAAAGIEEKIPPWSAMISAVFVDSFRSTCPHVDCLRYDDCAKVPDVYQELYGLAGIAPITEARSAES